MRPSEKRIAKADFLISGITCSGCVNTIEKRLKSIDGVESAAVNIVTNQANCEINLNVTNVDEICDGIKSLGFDAQLLKLNLTNGVTEMSKKSFLLSPSGSAASDSTAATELSGAIPESGASLLTLNLVPTRKRRWCFTGSLLSKEVHTAVREIKNIYGVHSCNILLSGKDPALLICYDSHCIGARIIYNFFKQKLTGYQIIPTKSNHTEQNLDRQFKSAAKKVLFCILPTIIISAMAMTPHNQLPDILLIQVLNGLSLCALIMFILTTPIHFICGWQFHRKAFSALRNRYMTMDLLVSLSTNLAYFYSVISVILSMVYFSNVDHTLTDLHGEFTRDSVHSVIIPHYFETPAVLITVLLIGKLIESAVKQHNCRLISRLNPNQKEIYSVLRTDIVDEEARQSSENLLLQKSSTAEIYQDVPAPLLQINDIIRIEDKTLIPADGVVERSLNCVLVDESILTGESIKIAKTSGDKVYAGSKVVSGILFMRVTEVSCNTFLGQVQALVEAANAKKSRAQVVADKVSQWFVPGILLISLLTFTFWLIILNHSELFKDSFESKAVIAFKFAVAVIAVACPCALGLATPTAVALATGAAAKVGILIRNIDVIQEASQKITDVIFDKTGTLTTGYLNLSYIATIPLDTNTKVDPMVNYTADFSDEEEVSDIFQTNSVIELSDLIKTYLSSDVSIPQTLIKNMFYNNSVLVDKSKSQVGKDDFDLFLLWLIVSLEQKHPNHLISKAFTDFYSKNVEPLLVKQKFTKLVPAPIIIHKVFHNGVKGVLNCSPWLNYNDELKKPVLIAVTLGNLSFMKEQNIKYPSNDLSSEKLDSNEFLTDETSGLSMLYLAINNVMVSTYGLADTVRPEALDVINILRSKYDCNIWMCTGDTRKNALMVAKRLHIASRNVKYKAQPKDKTDFVKYVKGIQEPNMYNKASNLSIFKKKLLTPFQKIKNFLKAGIKKLRLSSISSQSPYLPMSNSKSLKSMDNKCISNIQDKIVNSKRRILMIGDGINDGPSLAQADLGVAVGAQTQLTAEAADVILIDYNLNNLISFLKLSQTTVSIIRQNYLWAIVFNLFAIPVAAGVLYPTVMLPPALAGCLMALSSIVVVLNSLRLLAFKNYTHKINKEYSLSTYNTV